MTLRKISVNKEVKDSSIYIFSNFLIKFGSFLMVPLFWRKFTPADYGIISLTEIIGIFVSVFLGLSLDMSITRFYYEWPEADRPKRVGTIWVISWISSVLIGMLIIGVGRHIFPVLFPDVKFYPYLFLGLVNSILLSFVIVFFATVRIKQLPILYCALSVSTFIINLFLNIYFVLILDFKLYGFFISNIIAASINVFIISFVMFRFAKPNLLIDEPILNTIKFSLPMIPANLIASLTSIMDRFLLQRFATLETLGIYAVCLKFASVINSLHGALKMSYIPLISKLISDKSEEVRNKIAKLSYYNLASLILAGMFISIFIREFVFFMNRPAYFSVVNYVPFLVIATLLSVANIYLSPGLFLAKRLDLVWIPSVVQLIMTIAGGYILIPRYGIYGIIIYQYISNIFFLSVYYYLSNKVYPLRFNWVKLCFGFCLASFGGYICNTLYFNTVVNVSIKIVYILFVFSLLLNFSELKKIINIKIANI